MQCNAMLVTLLIKNQTNTFLSYFVCNTFDLLPKLQWNKIKNCNFSIKKYTFYASPYGADTYLSTA